MVAFAKGMPRQRFVFVPQPVMGKSPAELRAYADGIDPVTGRPVMTEVIDALTKPLTDEDTKRVSFERSTPRFVEPDSEDALQQRFLDNNWTDKLPIVLPTRERVDAMLHGTSRKPDEVVGRMRPTNHREAWEFTVEKVAVNAVMAGARPEYLPVILAMAASGVTARPSTTSSSAAMAVVNGPIRGEIGMNWGTGALGPYNHANATIGRAYSLLSQNGQGGSEPGKTYLGSMGNAYGYSSVTFAEHEERSPWEPFHVQQGFKREDSVVSLFSGVRGTAYTLGVRERYWRQHVQNLLRGIDPHGGKPTFVLDPITARLFMERGGFDTAAKFLDWACEIATLPAGVFWDYQLVQNYTLPPALNGVEPYATWLKAKDDEMIPMWRRKDFQVLVVGGETNGYWRIFGGGYSKSVSVDDWR